MFRKVGNLNIPNMSLRKANKDLRLQVKLEKEGKDMLNLLVEIAEI